VTPGSYASLDFGLEFFGRPILNQLLKGCIVSIASEWLIGGWRSSRKFCIRYRSIFYCRRILYHSVRIRGLTALVVAVWWVAALKIILSRSKASNPVLLSAA
jgi:hypothetical protein